MYISCWDTVKFSNIFSDPRCDTNSIVPDTDLQSIFYIFVPRIILGFRMLFNSVVDQIVSTLNTCVSSANTTGFTLDDIQIDIFSFRMESKAEMAFLKSIGEDQFIFCKWSLSQRAMVVGITFDAFTQLVLLPDRWYV